MQTTTSIDWAKVRKLARAAYNEIRLDDRSHPSFAAEKALEYASEMLGVPDHGVEGMTFADSVNSGIQYLNMGDTYDTTVYAITDRYGAKFYVGSWGDYVERHPKKFD